MVRAILPLLDGLRGVTVVAGIRTWIEYPAGGVGYVLNDGPTHQPCNTLRWRGGNGR